MCKVCDFCCQDKLDEARFSSNSFKAGFKDSLYLNNWQQCSSGTLLFCFLVNLDCQIKVIEGSWWTPWLFCSLEKWFPRMKQMTVNISDIEHVFQTTGLSTIRWVQLSQREQEDFFCLVDHIALSVNMNYVGLVLSRTIRCPAKSTSTHCRTNVTTWERRCTVWLYPLEKMQCVSGSYKFNASAALCRNCIHIRRHVCVLRVYFASQCTKYGCVLVPVVSQAWLSDGLDIKLAGRERGKWRRIGAGIVLLRYSTWWLMRKFSHRGLSIKNNNCKRWKGKKRI